MYSRGYCTLFLVLTFAGVVCYLLFGILCFYKKGGGYMLRLKIDVLEELKTKGFSTYVLRKDNLLGQKTISDLRVGVVPGIKSIDIICSLLRCQPGDIIEHIDN